MNSVLLLLLQDHWNIHTHVGTTPLLEETCWLLLLKLICTEEGATNIADFELAALKGLKYKWIEI